MNNNSRQLNDGLFGMSGTQEEIATIDLIEHGTLILSSQPHVATRLHGCDHYGGTVLADPEARGGRLGYLTIELRQREAARVGEHTPEDTHDVGIALTSEFNCRTKGFQKDKR